MTSASPAQDRPVVLLLAGEVRDAWSRALIDGGFEVRPTGWLDGVTAARLARPDLVLVSADLPANAPERVLFAFRSAGDLRDVPLVLAGVSPEVVERAEEAPPAFAADGYVPATVSADALVDAVRQAVRTGRVRRKQKAADVAVGVLVGLGVLAVMGRWAAFVIADAPGGSIRLDPAADAIVVAAALGVLGAALAVHVTRKGPLSSTTRRTLLGWAGLLLWTVGAYGPPESVLRPLAVCSGCVAWAAWAWLGVRVKPRSPRARRGFVILAGALLLLAAVPWILRSV